MDIHGNIVNVGEYVYTCEAATGGSKSKRLLYCKVLEINITGKKAKLQIMENSRIISKTTACCVKPLN